MSENLDGTTEINVSEKSTKAEILKAFRILQSGKPAMNDGEKEGREKTVKVEKERIIRSESNTIETVIGELSKLKVQVGKTVAELEQRMLDEAAKLSSIQMQIADEESRLRELFEIEATADSLVELIRAGEEKKSKYDQEMVVNRASWEKEQSEHELALRERNTSIKKEREREEEEYQYNLKSARKREDAAFAESVAEAKANLAKEIETKESELHLREQNLAARENELAELKVESASFPAQLAKQVQEAEKRAVKTTEEQFKLERLLLEKDIEKERELNQLSISALQQKIKEQGSRILVLEQDLKEAIGRSQSIAAKAVDGITGMRVSPQESRESTPSGSKEN